MDAVSLAAYPLALQKILEAVLQPFKVGRAVTKTGQGSVQLYKTKARARTKCHADACET